jgi:hypothetical protein
VHPHGCDKSLRENAYLYAPKFHEISSMTKERETLEYYNSLIFINPKANGELERKFGCKTDFRTNLIYENYKD